MWICVDAFFCLGGERSCSLNHTCGYLGSRLHSLTTAGTTALNSNSSLSVASKPLTWHQASRQCATFKKKCVKTTSSETHDSVDLFSYEYLVWRGTASSSQEAYSCEFFFVISRSGPNPRCLHRQPDGNVRVVNSQFCVLEEISEIEPCETFCAGECVYDNWLPWTSCAEVYRFDIQYAIIINDWDSDYLRV